MELPYDRNQIATNRSRCVDFLFAQAKAGRVAVNSTFLLSGHGSEVAFAHLYLHAIALALDRDAAKRAVKLCVRRGVAGDVLRAEFVLNLLEGGLQFVAIIAYIDQATARFL
jgi:hypothetical protein